MSDHQIAIVGGGVIGAACAYYLAKSGCNVTILERDRFGKACSHGNCGLIVPSHVLPLTEPGALKDGFQAFFSPDSPLRIRPGLNVGLWNWLIRFASRCNEKQMMRGAAALQPLLDCSEELYQELFGQEQLDCEYECQGVLYVYRTEKGMQAYEPTDRLLREKFNVASRWYDGNELTELEPALKGGLAGGWLYEHDAHLRPDRLLACWARLLKQLGVTVRESTQVTGLLSTAGQVKSLQTTRGDVVADKVVIAAGAWTPLLNRALRMKIPIQPGKGYSMTMPRPAKCPRMPLLLQEHRVAVTPMQSGYRLGSMMELVGYDESIDPRRIELLRTNSRHYLHEPDAEPVEERWTGFRPMTPDGLPIIGKAAPWKNVYLATGHNMLGLTLAPATGKLLAEQMTQNAPHLDLEPYSPSRFG